MIFRITDEELSEMAERYQASEPREGAAMSKRTATLEAADPKAGMSYDELVDALALYRDPKPTGVKVTAGMGGQIKKIELRWEAK